MKRFIIYFIIFLAAFSGPMLWVDEIDPAFIGSEVYADLLWVYFPIISLLLFGVFIFFTVYMYRTNKIYAQQVRGVINSERKEHLYILLLPVITWFFLHAAITPSIKIINYYYADNQWSEEFTVTKISDCGSGYYQFSCSKINVSSTKREYSTSFRWYVPNEKVKTLEHKVVNLIGYSNMFGSTVERINSRS